MKRSAAVRGQWRLTVLGDWRWVLDAFITDRVAETLVLFLGKGVCNLVRDVGRVELALGFNAATVLALVVPGHDEPGNGAHAIFDFHGRPFNLRRGLLRRGSRARFLVANGRV